MFLCSPSYVASEKTVHIFRVEGGGSMCGLLCVVRGLMGLLSSWAPTLCLLEYSWFLWLRLELCFLLCWCLPWGSFSVGSILVSAPMISGPWFSVRCNWQSSGFFSAASWSWGSSGARFLPVLPNHLKANQKLPLCGILWLSWGIFFFWESGELASLWAIPHFLL